jgi:ankyrin repeat protein
MGDLKYLKSILSNYKMDVNIVDQEGRTALMFAALGDHYDCVKFLLSFNALLHISDKSGMTRKYDIKTSITLCRFVQ